MKRAGICLWMMIKRMGRRPVYWILLLLFPAAVFVVPGLNKAAEEEQIPVGYVMEEAESGQTGNAEVIRGEEPPGSGQEIEEDAKQEETEYGQLLLAGIEGKLREGMERPEGVSGKTSEGMAADPAVGEKNLFRYIKYTDGNVMKEDIQKGELSCGVVFHKDFTEKLREQDYHHCITLYLPEGMNVGGMVQEDVFQRVYQAYSAVWYAELLGERGYRITPEEVLQKFSEYQKEGKVFAVNYEVSGERGEEVQNAAESEENASALSLRGMLAFLTLMSASLGALDGSRDRKKGCGKGISCPGHLAAAAVGAPILLSVLCLAGGMLFMKPNMTDVSYMGTGKLPWAVWVLQESGSALLYGLFLWLSAMLFSKILPEKLLEGIMPCFWLLVLLCCPVFFDLGETLPLAGYVSKLFPVTWYLEFWG